MAKSAKHHVGVLLLLLGCGHGAVEEAPEPDEVLYGSVKARDLSPTVDGADFTSVVNAEKRLAIELYRRLGTARPGENIAVGPYTVANVLGMIYAGARGETAAEMAQALEWTVPPERFHGAMNFLDLELRKRREDVTLEIASRVFIQRGLDVSAAFLDTLTRDYGAPMAVTDFSDVEAARAGVNDWVGRVTHDKITELFPQGTIQTQTVMVLVNALYVDAPWKYSFDPAQTSKRPFTTGAGSTVQVDTMYYDKFLPRATSADWKAVELPYKGDELSLVVIVPRDMAAFEAGLSVASLDAVIAAIEDGGIHLYLPKITFKMHASLVDALKDLGIRSLFANADLSGITGSISLSVQAIEHEVYLEMDEAGTKAAAATGGSIPASHGPTIDVNKPFLFVLRDRPTGAILFLGRVLDPQ